MSQTTGTTPSHQLASTGTSDTESANASAASVIVTSDVRLEEVYKPIQDSLLEVNAILRRELQSETPFVDELLEHSWLMGGKRIRPVFLLLSGACCGPITQSHLQMAAALEMIHTATLVHDDVLDEAQVRRHRATTNATWGSKTSILLGDYLFTHAFHVGSISGSCESLRMLALASNRVCEGEMRQNAWQGNFELSQQDYLKMITEKTAELCGVGCRIGAFLSGANPGLVDGFESYGRNLGVAFQIIDDVLDIVGQDEEVGKTLGTDLVNQKPTLPVIHCLQKLPTDERSKFLALLNNSGATVNEVLPFLESMGSIDYAREVAQQHAQSATNFSSGLAENKFSKALILLAQFVLERTR